MFFRKSIFVLASLIIATALLADTAAAQWSIGGSYEIRNEDPQNGFGVRVERELLPSAPIAKLALRGHFSYFNEENSSIYAPVGGNFSTDITSYDYGIAALGGVSVGLVSPYVGMGIGSTTFDLSVNEGDFSGEGSESNLYWNGFVGARVSPLPFIKPFVEYRLQAAEDYEDLVGDIDTSDGRLIFGLYLTF